MRLWALLRGDVRFQYKYGFYFLYMFLALLYIGMLSVFPDGWKERPSDDLFRSAAMGLYFRTIVLLERASAPWTALPFHPQDTGTPCQAVFHRVISVIVGLTMD